MEDAAYAYQGTVSEVDLYEFTQKNFFFGSLLELGCEDGGNLCHEDAVLRGLLDHGLETTTSFLTLDLSAICQAVLAKGFSKDDFLVMVTNSRDMGSDSPNEEGSESGAIRLPTDSTVFGNSRRAGHPWLSVLPLELFDAIHKLL